ncbi:MAG: VOC family protein, partial [Promethearchaeota archaeon]
SIEIFEWIKGDSVYKEFVDTQKEGLHHFGVFVENLQEYVDYLKKQGIEVIQTGMFPPRLKYAYMDTLKIFGVVIEFIELVKRKRKN